uniref:Serine/threonine-protein phosphatase 4 regulatory subunit 4 n=1 Tax=Setaria digitata TaxID=48799 RepID=A0A915Q2A9_9BILA
MSNPEIENYGKTEQIEKTIDWKSLLNTADDPDLIELLQSPIDDAISVLKSGREIQKLSIIRTLSDLLETDGDQVVEKVMPLIQVLPLTISQAETSQRAQRRVLATRLLNKLCAILGPSDIRRDIIPCVQTLCNDPNSNVRSSIAQHLGVIAESLRNPSDCASMLMPCLVQLCKDTEVGTRETALNSISLCIPFLSKEHRKCSIIPLLKRCTEQAVAGQDETLTVVAKNLGQWIDLLQDVLTARDHSWFLDVYIRIANLSQCSPSSDNGTVSNIQLSARRMCAYNFPCMVLKYGEDSFKDRLLPILESFCSDSDDDIRSATAAGFHEVVKLIPNEPTLLPPFFDLIRGSPAEVVGHLMSSLDQILPALYKCVSEQKNCAINRLQLDRILIGCNRLIRGSSSWRAQHSYLQNIAVLRHLIPAKDLFVSFVPVLKQEVLTTRAIPCRVAASVTLLLFMRENPNIADRQSIIDFFVHSIAKHRNCHRRRLFLDIIPEVIANFSRNFFHTYFLTPILEMAYDKVANIRLQLCRMLPKIKTNLYLPQDEEILQRMEGIIRELLSKEQSLSVRQLIQTYACELSRAETRINSDKSDKLKEKAENEIWDRKESVEVVEGKENDTVEGSFNEKRASEKDTGRFDKGAWRTHIQHPKTAVVRPQPQVVVTQRSPSPMPRNFSAAVEERKSRLPLASSQDKKYLVAQHKTVAGKTSLPARSRRGSNDSTTKSHLSAGHSSSTTWARKPPTGLITDKTKASSLKIGRSSTTSTMSRSMSFLNGTGGLVPSRPTSLVPSSGQGLIKVRSFSNIARTPTHLSMKVKTVN